MDIKGSNEFPIFPSTSSLVVALTGLVGASSCLYAIEFDLMALAYIFLE